MSDLNLSAKLTDLPLDHDYEVNVSIDLPEGTFAAVEENDFDEASGTRTVQVSLMKLHTPEEGTENAADADPTLSPAGSMEVSSGMYYRMDGENNVKVVVMQDGSEVASTTVDY